MESDSIICPEQLCDIINDESVLVIDVRECSMLQDTPPINAANWMNLPRPELEMALNMNDEDFELKYNHEKPKRDERIIVYCFEGIWGSQALEVLRGLGFTNAVHYPGAAQQWQCLKENIDFCPNEISDRELSESCAILQGKNLSFKQYNILNIFL